MSSGSLQPPFPQFRAATAICVHLDDAALRDAAAQAASIVAHAMEYKVETPAVPGETKAGEVLPEFSEPE